MKKLKYLYRIDHNNNPTVHKVCRDCKPEIGEKKKWGTLVCCRHKIKTNCSNDYWGYVSMQAAYREKLFELKRSMKQQKNLYDYLKKYEKRPWNSINRERTEDLSFKDSF